MKDFLYIKEVVTVDTFLYDSFVNDVTKVENSVRYVSRDDHPDDEQTPPISKERKKNVS